MTEAGGGLTLDGLARILKGHMDGSAARKSRNGAACCRPEGSAAHCRMIGNRRLGPVGTYGFPEKDSRIGV